MGARDATAGAHVAQREVTAVAQRCGRARARVAQPRGAGLGVVPEPKRRSFVTVCSFWAFSSAVLAGALGAGGCRADGTPGASDAAADAPGEAAVKLCSTRATCDDVEPSTVRACRDGHAAEVIEACAPGEACSLGRCASSACAAIEHNLGSIVGCTFYTLHLDNVASDDMLPSSAIVTNPGQSVATATLEQRAALERGAGGRWSTVASVTIPPMRSARLALPLRAFGKGGLAAQLALRVVSDQPVTVAHVQSDGTSETAPRSAGATLLLPAHVLGRRYRAVTYPQVATPAVVGDAGGRQGAGQILLVGVEDGTTIQVTPPPSVVLDAQSRPTPLDANGAFTVVLDEGDYFQVFSSHDGDDLTGTVLVGDKAFAAFSGNISTTYGLPTVGTSSADLAHEQLLPIGSWGQSYVAAPLPPTPGVCDSLFDEGPSSIWGIVADRDDTHVTFLSAADGNAPFAPPRTLAAGESFRLVAPVGGSFVVSASAPIEVTQGMDCEATLASAVPTDPLLTDFWFATLPSFDALAAIVRKAGKPVYLDGARLDEASFERAGSGFEVAQIPLASCPLTEGVCTHHLAGQFGFTMRGQDVLTSWALTVPTWVACSDPDAPGCRQ
jgi:hypothetical protein